MRFKTNLYDDDGLMERIYFYDENGHYQLTTYCNKRLAKYDMVKNAILIPAKGIKIQTNSDDDDDDENEKVNSFKHFLSE